MDLIIVESPSKAKTISRYLKGKYKVDASGGHIRDLPQKKLGVAVDRDYEPRYVTSPGKEEIIHRLFEEAKKADRVYLATDPDREGEAISWHLQSVLGLPEDGENRIEFNEISPKAVERALKNPRRINYNLVDAQQARRVLDRLVGYKLSPLLNNKIQNGLSAGRVQSVALRLVVEREREITAFKPEEYWTISAEMRDLAEKFPSFRAILEKKKGKKIKVTAKAQADGVLAALNAGSYIVSSVKKTVAKSHAPAPFTTSTLQQDASNKLGLSAPETMLMAQHLYEGMDLEGEGHVAFVTYIRTDSTRVSQDAQVAARQYIEEKFGKEYLPAKPNYYASKKGAQDAHEAIRPIDLARTPESVKKLLDRKHYNVYKLIYERFIASQMAEAQYDSMQIEIANGDYGLKASGRALRFAGFTAIYADTRKEDEDEAKGLLPALSEGEPLNALGINAEQKFTKPPVRYTDASLVKAMEDKGIGRPSTYASIISVLTKRRYVEKEGKYMKPTEIAYRITDMLVQYFTDVMDVGFTADMEEKLDEIEDGGKDWRSIIAAFYPPFEEKLRFASTDGDVTTEILCEKCGHPMIRKTGKYGKYLACSNYPTCSNIVSEGEVEISSTPCPKCGELMVIKSGRYGKFLACPNYPTCKSTLPFGEEPKEEIFEGVCPDCGKPTKRLKTRTGKTYYGCSGYPACKFMSWDIPTGDKCPKCGGALVKTARGTVKCSGRECSYKVSAPRAPRAPKAE
ncbi:MAG: type I DNA topoisomerase [Clostridia bacterium]|nr:type I DNA topoisomerase [Clostridia bacterium]